MTRRFPELELLHAIPNGQVRRGHSQEPGILPGMPDLCLPVPAGEFAALYIELKTPEGRLSKNQKIIHKKLQSYGNQVITAYSIDEATDAIMRYLSERRHRAVNPSPHPHDADSE